MKIYPTITEIEGLHKNYAPSADMFELVFTHCKIVRDIALQIIETKSLDLNIDLVVAGALLHDIGTYKFIKQFEETGTSKYYQHALEGCIILLNEGFTEELPNLVLHHMRVGLTKEAVIHEKLDIPAEDYSPTTIEERLVMYADKFHSKTPKFNSYESYKKFVSQFGHEQVTKLGALADEFGIPELESLAKKYNHQIV